MISIHMLELGDIMKSTDWCRPLRLCSMCNGRSDSYSFTSMYSGTPENNTKWAPANYVFGPVWYGREIDKDILSEFEFIRGDIPNSHKLDLSDYRPIG